MNCQREDENIVEPEPHITRIQTLRWHNARKDIPEMNRVCLIKVPGRPWGFDGKGDMLHDVAYLDLHHEFINLGPFAPGSYAYDKVAEWAYLYE